MNKSSQSAEELQETSKKLKEEPLPMNTQTILTNFEVDPANDQRLPISIYKTGEKYSDD
jgi:hypothetical protein